MATIAVLDVVMELKDDKYKRELKDALGETQTAGMKFHRALAGAAGVAGGFVVATTALGRFAEVGTRSLNVQSAFAARVGDVDAAMSLLRTETRGLISEYELMRQANMALTLGSADSAEEFGVMAAAAQKLGKALGIDAGYALESLNTGIARQSRLFLDNLGIIVDVDKANRDYAAALGITVQQLTDAQRAEAFKNEAMRQAIQITEELGEQTRTAGDAYRELIVLLSDGRTGLSEWVATSPAVIGFFDNMSQAVRIVTGDLEDYDTVMARVRARQEQEAGSFQFLPENTTGEQLARTVDEMASARAEVAEYRARMNEALAEQAAFNGLLDDLGSRILPIAEPQVKMTGVAFDGMGGSANIAKEQLKQAGVELAKKDLIAGKYTATMLAATAAQDGFNASLGDLQSLLGSIGSIASIFGGIPFLGQASSFLGGLGGLLGLGGGGGAKVKKFGGFKADGGPVSAGRSYIVGERGPELFTPSTSGQIVPNGGGTSMVVNVPPASSRLERMHQEYLYEVLKQFEHNGVRVRFA